jgi:hypothetical protein
MDLYNYFLSNKAKPIHKNKHYFPIYNRHFEQFSGRPITFLEIGAGGGGSSQMWKRYFGSAAKIVTIDIRPECAAFADDQVSVRIGDQSDGKFLDSIISEFGPPDVVLDDGSHQMHHVIATFKHLYDKIDRNGVYMVEDMHTSYWTPWGGGLRKPGTFIELCKTLIDELNGDHIHGPLRPPSVATDAAEDFQPTTFTRETRSMHFYDSVIVFEKGRSDPDSKRSLITGDSSLPIG